MNISIRINDDEEKLFKAYASVKNISLSTLFKECLIEKIEEETDIALLKEAKEYNSKNLKKYTHDELVEALGL